MEGKLRDLAREADDAQGHQGTGTASKVRERITSREDVDNAHPTESSAASRIRGEALPWGRFGRPRRRRSAQALWPAGIYDDEKTTSLKMMNAS